MRCGSFGKFCLVHLAGLYITKSVPSTCSHTALGQNACSSEKRGRQQNFPVVSADCAQDLELRTLVYLLLVTRDKSLVKL